MAAPNPAQSSGEPPEPPEAPEPPAPAPAPVVVDASGGVRLLAEPGQRLVARIVDTLVVGLPVIVVVRAAVSGQDVDVVAPPAVAGCLLLYEVVQLAIWGRTLGKRFAGIEVVAAEGGPALRVPRAAEPAAGGPAAAEESAAPLNGAEALESQAGLPGGPGSAPEAVSGRLGILRALLRAAVYTLPIAVRPVPVLGLIAGVFWVANAGAMYEGTRRQAVHDRLAGTVVVRRPRRESAAS